MRAAGEEGSAVDGGSHIRRRPVSRETRLSSVPGRPRPQPQPPLQPQPSMSSGHPPEAVARHEPLPASKQTSATPPDTEVDMTDAFVSRETDDPPLALEAKRAVEILNPSGKITMPRPPELRVMCVANQKGGVGKT